MPRPGSVLPPTGADGEDGGITVQLFPYADTPNNGGVYKVWVTPTSDLDCNAAGNKHCFVPRYSKTDNFKVRDNRIVEIDTRFWKHDVPDPLDGMLALWTDTNGATNAKYSEYNPAILHRWRDSDSDGRRRKPQCRRPDVFRGLPLHRLSTAPAGA